LIYFLYLLHLGSDLQHHDIHFTVPAGRNAKNCFLRTMSVGAFFHSVFWKQKSVFGEREKNEYPQIRALLMFFGSCYLYFFAGSATASCFVAFCLLHVFVC
jgi:hypothetical protein